jgi:hypothetical protein
MSDKLLRLDAAAELVFGEDSGINGRTLYRAAQAGALKHYRVSGKHFTTEAFVREWACRPPVPRRAATKHPPPTAADVDASQARARGAIEALMGK